MTGSSSPISSPSTIPCNSPLLTPPYRTTYPDSSTTPSCTRCDARSGITA